MVVLSAFWQKKGGGLGPLGINPSST